MGTRRHSDSVATAEIVARRLGLRLQLGMALLALMVAGVSGCAVRAGRVHDELATAADRQDPLAICDALEALIDAGTATLADRQFAYDAVCAHPEDSAAYDYARAAITGRLVQQKGLLAANLIADVEHYARRSREIDPTFREGAATRLLGTLYVLAPGPLLHHGDSEEGLALLEGLAEKHPEVLENQLRLAEAYIALGDAEPAHPHLCRCIAQETSLRPDDRRLLHQLIGNSGTLQCPPASPPGTSPAPRA